MAGGRSLKRRIRQHRVNVEIFLEEIDDNLPSQIKDALALRNAANLSNQCPVCLAAGEYAGLRGHGNHLVIEMYMGHQPGCVASDDGLHELLLQYGSQP